MIFEVALVASEQHGFRLGLVQTELVCIEPPAQGRDVFLQVMFDLRNIFTN